MSFRKYHQWNAEQDAYMALQLARIDAAIKQCEHIATPQELADAAAVLEADPTKPDLFGYEHP
jgi:hypothetical protein